MKKKFLSLVLTFAFIISGLTMLVGCTEPAPVEVKIGNESYTYEVLTDAIVETEQTEVIKIKLNKDVVLTETFHITTNEYEINLNGHNVSFPTDSNGDGLFWVENDAKLTINGNGTVNSASQNNNYSMAVWANNGGEVVINGGTYTNVGAKDFGTEANNNELIYASREGIITINGGKFIGNYENATFGTRYALNIKDENPNTSAIEAGTLIVKGGEYCNYDPANSLSENPKGNFVAEGYVSTEETRDSMVWFVVSAE